MFSQETTIGELRAFISDTLSEIFHLVSVHSPEIAEERRRHRLPVDFDSMSNPFALYESYLDIVKPVTYNRQVDAIKNRIADLQERLERETERTDTLQRSVQKYIDEETAIKLEMETLRTALVQQKEDCQQKIKKANLYI